MKFLREAAKFATMAAAVFLASFTLLLMHPDPEPSVLASSTYAPKSGDPCALNARLYSAVNLTASGQIITGSAGNQAYICSMVLVLSATADNVALVEGTGSTCGTNTAGMAGGATTSTGWNLPANAILTATPGPANVFYYKTATAGDNVCLLASSAAQISGAVYYVEQ
jgi:hypothetical protein